MWFCGLIQIVTSSIWDANCDFPFIGRHSVEGEGLLPAFTRLFRDPRTVYIHPGYTYYFTGWPSKFSIGYWAMFQNLEHNIHLPNLTLIENCWELLKFANNCWIILRTTENYWELLRFTEYYWVLLRIPEYFWDES